MKIIRFTSVDALRDEICKSGLEQFVVVKLDDRKVTFDSNFLQRMEEDAADSYATIT